MLDSEKTTFFMRGLLLLILILIQRMQCLFLLKTTKLSFAFEVVYRLIKELKFMEILRHYYYVTWSLMLICIDRSLFYLASLQFDFEIWKCGSIISLFVLLFLWFIYFFFESRVTCYLLSLFYVPVRDWFVFHTFSRSFWRDLGI